MSFFHIDKVKFPLVIITINGGPTNNKEMKSFLTEWQNVYVICMQESKRYKLVFDARDAGMVDLDYLRALATWLGTMKELTKKWMDKTAIIVTRTSVRGLIQFVLKYYKAVRPFKVFTKNELKTALDWLYTEDMGDLEAERTINLSELELTKTINFT